ncbi:hypothetical protein [Wenyingzhuangia sp. 2_MG-2023]|uniref:hypothetical protein n=1 Tax=Wenyingzhuangia sp. 2_MG-2023 TaxID=3062639 RepID=UPI0026E17352|nr:hypothetical protein [Wenyingzhuangia sp. 2_MG-2023]MDO6737127.1 hypothetical protein [Wenyingzhuangia sp. 2_MG-2023]
MEFIKVKIKKSSFRDIWYNQSIGDEFKVSEHQHDSEFYNLVGEKRVIYKDDCYISNGAVRKKPIPETTIEERFIKDGYNNASHALSVLGTLEFKKKYIGFPKR